MFASWSQEQHIELLWTGPSPASQMPTRRIDQVLYDLRFPPARDTGLPKHFAVLRDLLGNALRCKGRAPLQLSLVRSVSGV